jgi:hypothetical protein
MSGVRLTAAEANALRMAKMNADTMRAISSGTYTLPPAHVPPPLPIISSPPPPTKDDEEPELKHVEDLPGFDERVFSSQGKVFAVPQFSTSSSSSDKPAAEKVFGEVKRSGGVATAPSMTTMTGMRSFIPPPSGRSGGMQMIPASQLSVRAPVSATGKRGREGLSFIPPPVLPPPTGPSILSSPLMTSMATQPPVTHPKRRPTMPRPARSMIPVPAVVISSMATAVPQFVSPPGTTGGVVLPPKTKKSKTSTPAAAKPRSAAGAGASSSAPLRMSAAAAAAPPDFLNAFQKNLMTLAKSGTAGEMGTAAAVAAASGYLPPPMLNTGLRLSDNDGEEL